MLKDRWLAIAGTGEIDHQKYKIIIVTEYMRCDVRSPDLVLTCILELSSAPSAPSAPALWSSLSDQNNSFYSEQPPTAAIETQGAQGVRRRARSVSMSSSHARANTAAAAIKHPYDNHGDQHHRHPNTDAAEEACILAALNAWWEEFFSRLLECDSDGEDFSLVVPASASASAAPTGPTPSHVLIQSCIDQLVSWHRQHEPPPPPPTPTEHSGWLGQFIETGENHVPRRISSQPLYLAARAAIALILNNHINIWRLRWSTSSRSWHFAIDIYTTLSELRRHLDEWYRKACREDVEQEVAEIESRYKERWKGRDAALEKKIESAVQRWWSECEKEKLHVDVDVDRQEQRQVRDVVSAAHASAREIEIPRSAKEGELKEEEVKEEGLPTQRSRIENIVPLPSPSPAEGQKLSAHPDVATSARPLQPRPWHESLTEVFKLWTWSPARR
ncbi:hypothetical protein AC578_1119 [Pseudocercospora eumusae]|uniref:Uncharacterized protein n=1 Tax=Pseudocercospora eumusae TaxID=321146 RepID=A0A139GXE5_9PEZI|nr:hypothetical protein AC578_1119 [Pseudocercospora eumusae]